MTSGPRDISGVSLIPIPAFSSSEEPRPAPRPASNPTPIPALDSDLGRRGFSLVAIPPMRTPGNLPAPASNPRPPVTNATSTSVAAGDAGDRFRARVVELLDYYDGATEGDARFNAFRSPETLRAARIAAGKRGATFTTCIEFLAHVQSEAARTSGVRLAMPVNAALVDPKERAKLPEGAWHDMRAGDRPNPGDVLIMVFDENVYNADGSLKYGKGWFSHVALVRSTEANPNGGPEHWVTVDGGQGSATRYDRDGNLIQQGREQIKRVDRQVDPETGVLPGPPRRRIIGWVDMASMAQPR